MITVNFVATPDVAQAALASLVGASIRASSPPAGQRLWQPVIIDYNALQKAAAAGKTGIEAAKAIGVSHSTFKRRLTDDERFAEIWSTRQSARRKAALSVMPVERIRELAEMGADKLAIATAIGVSPYAFNHWTRKDPRVGKAWNAGRAAFLIRQFN